jgi:hypothetical protein
MFAQAKDQMKGLLREEEKRSMSDEAVGRIANPGSTLGEAIGALIEREVNRLLEPIAREHGCAYQKPDICFGCEYLKVAVFLDLPGHQCQAGYQQPDGCSGGTALPAPAPLDGQRQPCYPLPREARGLPPVPCPRSSHQTFWCWWSLPPPSIR